MSRFRDAADGYLRKNIIKENSFSGKRDVMCGIIIVQDLLYLLKDPMAAPPTIEFNFIVPWIEITNMKTKCLSFFYQQRDSMRKFL